MNAQPIETHPKSGRFWGWWRTKHIQHWTAVKWSDDGKYLVTEAGAVVHEAMKAAAGVLNQ